MRNRPTGVYARRPFQQEQEAEGTTRSEKPLSILIFNEYQCQTVFPFPDISRKDLCEVGRRVPGEVDVTETRIRLSVTRRAPTETFLGVSVCPACRGARVNDPSPCPAHCPTHFTPFSQRAKCTSLIERAEANDLSVNTNPELEELPNHIHQLPCGARL